MTNASSVLPAGSASAMPPATASAAAPRGLLDHALHLRWTVPVLLVLAALPLVASALGED
ncbi:MAG: branched-chain amino acid ABC transporter permease, partial [Comamonadaceae bacterium]